MRVDQDCDDLACHEAETELLGCVYTDPAEKWGAEAEISGWVVDALVGGPIGAALDDLVPRWVASSWPPLWPCFVGRDLTWQA